MYVYNDEDNYPMIDDDTEKIMKYTVYSSRAEMIAGDRHELDDGYDEPDHGCWDCLNYDPSREACTLRWNNNDESLYNPELDNRDPADYCHEHDTDPEADWHDFFGGDE